MERVGQHGSFQHRHATGCQCRGYSITRACHLERLIGLQLNSLFIICLSLLILVNVSIKASNKEDSSCDSCYSSQIVSQFTTMVSPVKHARTLCSHLIRQIAVILRSSKTKNIFKRSFLLYSGVSKSGDRGVCSRQKVN